MLNATGIQAKRKRIEDLTLGELDMVYSLSRTGWSSQDIAKRYRISDDDVRRVINDYVDLRRLCQERPTEEVPHPWQEQELVQKKQRKRRIDARYASPADRQAAYRARLREKHNAEMQQAIAPADTDADPELMCNGLPAPVAEPESLCGIRNR